MKQTNGNVGFARAMLWLAGIGSAFAFFMVMCGLAAGTGAGAGVALIFIMTVADVLVVWYAIARGVFFVMGVERKFNAVCRALGGSFKGEANDYGKSVVKGLQARPFERVETQKKTVYPSLSKVQGNREAWTALIRPLYGQNLDDYKKRADRFAFAFRVQFVSFDLDVSGLVRMRAGRMQVPVAYEYQEERW